MVKVLIIAGESSGDNLGADLIKEMVFQHSLKCSSRAEINQEQPSFVGEEIVVQGIGGPLMKQQGLVSLFRMEDLAVMGLTEVLPKLPKIFSIIKGIVRYVDIWKPDLIITIDSPDFSMKLVKRLRMIDKFVPIIHYVAPSVWAWRASRAKEMAKYYDHILTLLPFESDFFEKYGINCDFVGHPISRLKLPNQIQVNSFISKMNLDITKRVIAILPGSRKSEILFMLPIFVSVIRKLRIKFDDLEFVIPAPAHVSKLIENRITKEKVNVKILAEENFTSEEFKAFKFSLFGLSTVALATSGSVSLELARTGTPMITAYRCGWIFEMILKRFVNVKSANLINIILGQNLIPEFLFEKCTVSNLVAAISQLLTDSAFLLEQKSCQSEVIKALVGEQGRSSEAAARSVLRFLNYEESDIPK